MSFLNEGGVPIGLPGDVEDFKDLLNSLDFFEAVLLFLFLSRKKEEGNDLSQNLVDVFL